MNLYGNFHSDSDKRIGVDISGLSWTDLGSTWTVSEDVIGQLQSTSNQSNLMEIFLYIY